MNVLLNHQYSIEKVVPIMRLQYVQHETDYALNSHSQTVAIRTYHDPNMTFFIEKVHLDKQTAFIGAQGTEPGV